MKGFRQNFRDDEWHSKSGVTSLQRGPPLVLRMLRTRTTTTGGTYLFVKVKHGPKRGLRPSTFSGNGGNHGWDTATDLSNLTKASAPIACRCSSTVAIYALSPQPHSSLKAAKLNHSRASQSSRKLGCGFDSSTAIRQPGRQCESGWSYLWGKPLHRSSAHSAHLKG